MDPAKVRQHFDRIGHFRILVIGRSNAGKTTILQRVCNTTELPEITNAKGEKVDPVVVQGTLERGYHNIEDELIFRSNPGFIFHDSRGFEAGSDSELKLMKKFVAERATTMKLDKRIHAIWFCIPMTDYERTIVAAEKKFFNECNTAKVPVIVVLTKADALQFAAIEQLIDQGCTIEEAKEKAGEAAIQMLSKLKMRIETQLDRCKYPPKDCVSLASMNEDHGDCNPLLRCTTNALDEVELQKLVISTQQVNIVLNIEYAVKVILSTCNDPFHKEALEWNILGWMPCAKVCKAYFLFGKL
ncbi:P-loop containing nucleoside triphosphate hydrolase protein [Scleroderma yunnanense]